MSSPAASSLPPNLDPRGRRAAGRASGGGRGGRPSGPMVVAKILVAALSALTLLGAGYLWHEARGLDGAGKRENLNVKASGSTQNILLVGNDDRSNMTAAEAHQLHLGEDGGSMATDTMIIVHVPADGSKATLISLPRDSYVAIPGIGGDGKDKLNSAYAYGYNRTLKDDPHATKDQQQVGAINLLIQTVENLTGIDINHYIQVSLLGFVRISDAIGGVPIDLCHSVNDTHAHNVAEGQDGGSGLVLSKGKHTISGLTALEFVRQRHNLPGGDLDRVKRQQYFLTAAFRQVAGVGLVTKLNAIKGALDSSITADQGLSLIDLAKQMADLSADNISGKTIPTTNATLSDGTSILAVDPAKVRAFVAAAINPPAPSTPSSTPASTSARPSSTKSGPTAKKTTASTSTALDAKCVN